MTTPSKPRIAISSCLLGEKVRYDSGHKHNRYITGTLGEYFDFVPLCPEVAVGLGIPRPTIRLVVRDGEVRARAQSDETLDPTDELRDYGRKMASQIEGKVCGYLLKKDSPSCGMERVKVFDKPNAPAKREGVGIYAREILSLLPDLPVEEEGRLMDPGLRENFVERVFTYDRWLKFLDEDFTPAGLVKFHTCHKFFILAHDETTYRELGRIVADVGKGDLVDTAATYASLLMQGLKKQATPRKNANVLQHMMGFFKDDLDSHDKQELLNAIELHRQRLVPAIVPITLINYFRRKYRNAYIDDQVYLEPHPPELMLRNHI